MSPVAGIAPVVHVVDDDVGMRKALSTLLQAAGYKVSTYASAREFLLARPGSAPGCVILDVRMPGQSGLDTQQALAEDDAPLPIVFLTAHGDIPMSVRAVRAGAVDFLTKPVKRVTLLAAVDSALARDAAQRAGREELQALRSRYESLTAREQQVLALVVTGRLNKQTGDDLGIAERTVKIHRARAMEKMQAVSLPELVHMAERLGLGLSGPRMPPRD
jgi:FixJ family two-component response regulator